MDKAKSSYSRVSGPGKKGALALPMKVLSQILRRAGPRACARFGCCSRAAFFVAEQTPCWACVKGIGHLTISAPCGLEEAYPAPKGGVGAKASAFDKVAPPCPTLPCVPALCIPRRGWEESDSGPSSLILRRRNRRMVLVAQGDSNAARGAITRLKDEAVVRGRATGKEAGARGRQLYRPLSFMEFFALCRRCTEVEELALELEEDPGIAVRATLPSAARFK